MELAFPDEGDIINIKELLDKYGTLIVDDALFGNYRCTFSGGYVNKNVGVMRLIIRRNSIDDVYNSLYQRIADMINKIELERED